MKLNCGLTRDEKIARINEWHAWFAWYPVRVGSRDCRWLERVERRGWRNCMGWGWTFPVWEYRATGDE